MTQNIVLNVTLTLEHMTMRKITSMQAAPFSAKIFYDCQYGEYRVRFYRAGELMPECDAFETDEESARGTMELALRLMVRDAIREERDEAEQAREDMILECLRPYI